MTEGSTTPEPCGCRVYEHGLGRTYMEIEYCSTHDAAPAMYAALEECADKVGMAQLRGVDGCGPILRRARAALASAKGEASDLDTTTDPEAWGRAGHTCERETLDGASTCPHPDHRASAKGEAERFSSLPEMGHPEWRGPKTRAEKRAANAKGESS